jgi:tetratricopeptide (TPR) repeat protein
MGYICMYIYIYTCVCVCVLERDPEKLLLRNRQCTSALTFENLFFLPDTAISYYNQALERDPQNHFLYSNRSAAYAKLQDFWTAESDAQQVILFDLCFSPLLHMIRLAQDWPKGYSRLGVALVGQGKYAAARHAYEDALKLDPENAQIKVIFFQLFSLIYM